MSIQQPAALLQAQTINKSLLCEQQPFQLQPDQQQQAQERASLSHHGLLGLLQRHARVRQVPPEQVQKPRQLHAAFKVPAELELEEL